MSLFSSFGKHHYENRGQKDRLREEDRSAEHARFRETLIRTLLKDRAVGQNIHYKLKNTTDFIFIWRILILKAFLIL